MAEVVIIDYGMGNIHSVYKAVKNVLDKNSNVKVSTSFKDIKNSSHIILPGQGAVGSCMNNISQVFDLDEFKNHITKKPFLGICMGLQAVMSFSEEDEGVQCLDVITGKVTGFKSLGKNLKIPHMGWNKVEHTSNHNIWQDIENHSYFYFVHSYYVEPEDPKVVLGTTNYGKKFTSIIQKNSMIASQFHPEKSSKNGLQFLKNFLNWEGDIE
tara:strand:- start:5539 stop:6174 length:636 start_codon:yes stop_codon:yes gene_type:complete